MTSTAEPGSTTPTIGWQGRYFEDFAGGDRYQHPLGRTVIQTDNSWFTLLTQNSSPVHFDVHYAAQTEFGMILAFLRQQVPGPGCYPGSIGVRQRESWFVMCAAELVWPTRS
jgi:hypothetical protein